MFEVESIKLVFNKGKETTFNFMDLDVIDKGDEWHHISIYSFGILDNTDDSITFDADDIGVPEELESLLKNVDTIKAIQCGVFEFEGNPWSIALTSIIFNYYDSDEKDEIKQLVIPENVELLC